MASYSAKVKADIARWVEGGLIDSAIAERLAADVERNARGAVSFGAVLSMMAAALFAAAILIFIAANWEAMPRLVRVGLLFTLILAGYVGGAVLHLRHRPGFGEAAYLVGAAAFGASIALVGQMYHMSGDEKQAMLVWCAGVALAAVGLRSGALTVGAALLAGAWMLMHAFDHWTMRGLPPGYVALAAGLYAVSFWTRSMAARHLLLLSLWLFMFLLYWKEEDLLLPVGVVLAACGLFLFGWRMPGEAARLAGLGGGHAVQALIGFLSGVGLMQLVFVEEPGFVVPTLVAFAGIVAVLLLEGRESTPLRWLAYAAFVFQLGFVYVVMLGSMLGTAGFFVLGGLALSGLAWLIARLERRFAAPQGAPA